MENLMNGALVTITPEVSIYYVLRKKFLPYDVTAQGQILPLTTLFKRCAGCIHYGNQSESTMGCHAKSYLSATGPDMAHVKKFCGFLKFFHNRRSIAANYLIQAAVNYLSTDI